MEQQILKPEIIFTNGIHKLYCYTEFYKLEPDDISLEQVMETVCMVYPIIDYTIKGNTIYALTQEAEYNRDCFDLETAYTACIVKYNKSQPFFETDITEETVVVKNKSFDILPSSPDVFAQNPITLDDFKRNTIQELYTLFGVKDEQMFDNLLKSLYNAQKN